MKKKTLLLGLFGLMTLFGTIHAQEITPKGPAKMLVLSLSDAQAFARQHNATMANADLDVKKAEYAKWETLSSMLPQVKAGFDYQNMCGYQMNFGGMHIPMNPNGNFAITASVAVTGQQIVGTMISKLAAEMSETSRKQNEQNINSNVKNSYVTILVMEQTTALLDSTLANMQRLMKTTEAAVRAGAAEQTDADKLAVQVASIQSNLNSTRLSLKLLYNSLILQLGADVDAQLRLTTQLSEIVDVQKAAAVLNQKFDIENNYSYQLLQQNEQLSKDQLKMAWASFSPVISAFYQYSAKTYFGKDQGMNMTPPNVVGASISLPLWQTGTRYAQVRQAQINYEETLNAKRQAEDGLRVQYKQLCNDLITALENYKIQDANLEVCQRVLDKVSQKYRYAQASSLEVTNANSELIQAQSNYIQSIMSVVNAQVALEDLLNN